MRVSLYQEHTQPIELITIIERAFFGLVSEQVYWDETVTPAPAAYVMFCWAVASNFIYVFRSSGPLLAALIQPFNKITVFISRSFNVSFISASRQVINF